MQQTDVLSYEQATRLAEQGASVDELVSQCGLPRAEADELAALAKADEITRLSIPTTSPIRWRHIFSSALLEPASQESLLAQYPWIAYLAHGILFGLLALNSYLWAWFFTRAPGGRCSDPAKKNRKAEQGVVAEG